MKPRSFLHRASDDADGAETNPSRRTYRLMTKQVCVDLSVVLRQKSKFTNYAHKKFFRFTRVLVCHRFLAGGGGRRQPVKIRQEHCSLNRVPLLRKVQAQLCLGVLAQTKRQTQDRRTTLPLVQKVHWYSTRRLRSVCWIQGWR